MAVAQVSPARKAAYKILLAVERGQSHSDDLLRGKAVQALAAADRNLATTLVLGVLRWQTRLDEQLRPLLKRPGAKLDAEILIALRLGAFQLLHLDRVPAHAAIDESVELAKQAGHRFAAGMVNAVLRRVSRSEVLEQSTAGSPLGSNRSSAAQPASAHPAWMVQRWAEFYGQEAAGAICAHGQNQPRLAIRIIDPAAEQELRDARIELAPSELLAAARTVLAGDVTAAAAFQEGRVRMQDEGSQLVAELAAAVLFAKVDEETASGRGTPPPLLAAEKRILDTCAAPGGKTLLLAERHPAAGIVACEASPRRLAAMRERLSSLASRIECRLGDAAALGEDSAFDLALTDVPCSGTGTLGRNPEIRHRLRSEDLARQAQRQGAILRASLRAVRPGGRVVYSTCSLEPEENEQVVAAVLAENSGVQQVSVAECLQRMQRAKILTNPGAQGLANAITPEGALRLLPGAFGTDGFFVAVIEKLA